MKFGKLVFNPFAQSLNLVGGITRNAIESANIGDIYVAEIDPSFSDTAAFCNRYDVEPEVCVNCVIVEAKRGDEVWYAACLVPANKRADMNGIVRRYLNARKLSFAPRETAVTLTGMEFGGITPIGLPDDWLILVDEDVSKIEHTVIGSGVRASKLSISGSALSSLANATIMKLDKA